MKLRWEFSNKASLGFQIAVVAESAEGTADRIKPVPKLG
jgi:hypothetical protein